LTHCTNGKDAETLLRILWLQRMEQSAMSGVFAVECGSGTLLGKQKRVARERKFLKQPMGEPNG